MVLLISMVFGGSGQHLPFLVFGLDQINFPFLFLAVVGLDDIFQQKILGRNRFLNISIQLPDLSLKQRHLLFQNFNLLVNLSLNIRLDEVDEFFLGMIASNFILEEGESVIGLGEVGIILVGGFGDEALEEEGIFLPLLVKFVLLVVEFALHSGDPLFH